MALDLSELKAPGQEQAVEDLRWVTSEDGHLAALKCLPLLPTFIQGTTDAQRAATMQAAGENLDVTS